MYQLNIPPVGGASLKENRESESDPLLQSPANFNASPKSNVVGFNQSQQQVRQLPQTSAPAWLQSLLTIQRGASIAFCSVMGLSVVVYGYTARTQDTWKVQHQQLKRFQAQEHQQAVMTENLKQQMATTAEDVNSGLVAPTPDRLVFIPSAPQRPTKALATPPPPLAPKSKLPLGY
jgi:hypothetical protein